MKINAEQGFTTLEIVVVIIIISILSAIVVNQINTGNSKLVAFADTFKSHLRYAQTRSMNSDTVWSIRFLNNSSYALYKAGNANPYLLPGQDQPIVSCPTGITLNGGHDQSNLISFDSWGRPCLDIPAVLQQQTSRTLTVSNSAGSFAITIIKNTGFIQ